MLIVVSYNKPGRASGEMFGESAVKVFIDMARKQLWISKFATPHRAGESFSLPVAGVRVRLAVWMKSRKPSTISAC